MNIASAVSAIILCLVLVACGLVSSDYKPYEYVPNGDGTGTGEAEGSEGSAECPAGSQLAAYQANLATPVNATCASASCHASISKMLLKSNEDDANRQKILTYSTGDAALLIGFLHSAGHQGGNMSSVLSAAAIETWLATEAKCK